jgi:hypothetical protein
LEPGTTKNRDGRLFNYAELVEVGNAVEALWMRHEALARKGILSPLVFCRGRGASDQELLHAMGPGVHSRGLSRSHSS